MNRNREKINNRKALEENGPIAFVWVLVKFFSICYKTCGPKTEEGQPSRNQVVEAPSQLASREPNFPVAPTKWCLCVSGEKQTRCLC